MERHSHWGLTGPTQSKLQHSQTLDLCGCHQSDPTQKPEIWFKCMNGRETAAAPKFMFQTTLNIWSWKHDLELSQHSSHQINIHWALHQGMRSMYSLGKHVWVTAVTHCLGTLEIRTELNYPFNLIWLCLPDRNPLIQLSAFMSIRKHNVLFSMYDQGTKK